MTDVPSAVDLASIVNLDGFEAYARDRMSAPAFDYVAGGSWDEVTLDEAGESWQRYRFVPRVLRDVRRIDVSGSFLGRSFPMPVAIAPMAAQRLAHPSGEAEMLAGAALAGIPFCLSTTSSMTIEDVAAAAPDAERWFQLYVVGGMPFSRQLVQRAEAAGFRALLVTVDLPVLARRERDVRSGFRLPALPNIDEAEGERGRRYGAIEDQKIEGLTWESIAEMRSWSAMPIVVKGILSPDDARLAVEAGVDAIIVSTHGGRQLDRAIPAADALPAVAQAVAGRCEVWVDGGIRRGLDVLVAKALGATGVLVGRPFYWALAAAGREGVAHAARLLRAELEIALPLVGTPAIADIGPELLA